MIQLPQITTTLYCCQTLTLMRTHFGAPEDCGAEVVLTDADIFAGCSPSVQLPLPTDSLRFTPPESISGVFSTVVDLPSPLCVVAAPLLRLLTSGLREECCAVEVGLDDDECWAGKTESLFLEMSLGGTSELDLGRTDVTLLAAANACSKPSFT